MKKIVFVIILGIVYSCNTEIDPVYRERMREFVGSISAYAKIQDQNFFIIPQNGHELLTLNGDEEGEVQYEYLSVIDGAGQEDLFYGYESDNKATNIDDTEYLSIYLDIYESNGIEVLVTDYCSLKEDVDNSYALNEEKNYISFAAPERELNVIPSGTDVYNENSEDIQSLSDAKNFLYLINPDDFSTSSKFISAVSSSNYDLLIIDLFYKEIPLSPSDIAMLKVKQNGGKRLVIAYMSIGEAEDYRYYWNKDWDNNAPAWLDKENPKWKGNYKVEYWNKDWQAIIFGSQDSYLDKIINTGFDGVYLDIIEAFEFFE